MKGFRIINHRKKKYENGTSEFFFYFEPLLKLLNNHNWIFSPDSFLLPSEWFSTEPTVPDWPELASFRQGPVAETLNFKLCTNDFMSSFGRYVRDDWNDLFCFSSKQDGLKLMESLEDGGYYSGARLIKFLKENIDIYFSNYDAAFWEIFSKHEGFLLIIENVLENIDHLEIIECDISELEYRF